MTPLLWLYSTTEADNKILNLGDLVHEGYRYTSLGRIGQGGFGSVFKAYDSKSNRFVAIKMMRNVSDLKERAKEEGRILRLLNERDQNDTHNIVRVLDVFKYNESHVCLSLELLWMNLRQFSYQNDHRGFGMPLIKQLTYNILVALKFMFDNNVIHGDLKPENIMLCKPGSADLKLVDFGLSCLEDECCYQKIQSRHYRAPEVILGGAIEKPVDMWSLGCIVCELYIGNVLFAGDTEHELIACMMELIGIPMEDVLISSRFTDTYINASGSSRFREFHCSDEGVLSDRHTPFKKRKIGPPGTRDLKTDVLIGCDDDTFADFIRRCLNWNSDLRMKPSQALEHAWLVSAADASLVHSRCGRETAPLIPASDIAFRVPSLYTLM